MTLKNPYPRTLYADDGYSPSADKPSVVREDTIEYAFIDTLKTLKKEHHV
jgi:hypothetical protein